MLNNVYLKKNGFFSLDLPLFGLNLATTPSLNESLWLGQWSIDMSPNGVPVTGAGSEVDLIQTTRTENEGAVLYLRKMKISAPA